MSELKVYANAERTRTFIAAKVDGVHLNKMLTLSKKVDNVMDNFRLSTFYEVKIYYSFVCIFNLFF